MVNIFLPNLTQLGVVKIATVLWNNVDEYPQLFKFKIMKLKVRKLQLPDVLKLEIENFIDEMFQQTRNWEHYHFNMLYNNVQMPVKYIWTSYGTIDSKETIKATMKYSTADSLGKYKIACIQCVEDDIVLLWKELESKGEDLQRIQYKAEIICVYWAHKVTNNLDKLSYVRWYSERDDATPCEVALEYAAKGGFDVATRYLFEILNTESKQEILGNVARRIVEFNIPNVTVLVIFLLNMSREKQLKVFKDSYHNVLISLLDWPRNDLFLEVASYMWDLIPPRHHCAVFAAILRRMENLRYENLFHTLWQRSSEEGRCKVLTMLREKYFMLQELVVRNRREIIKHIFHYASTEDKAKIIFCCGGLIICKELVCTDKWHELKFFVQQCLSSKKDVMKLREILISWKEEVTIKDFFSTLISSM